MSADTALAAQPIGYWSGAANRAIITHIRQAMARLHVSQPQWWVLNQLAGAPTAMSQVELARRLRDYLDPGTTLGPDIETLLARGWITTGADGRLSLTGAGEAGRARIKELVLELRAQIHDGIDDAEYVRALGVLRRMISNVGGDPDFP
ncbi:MarR family winged helix-turn-helix transcriptional regulator [Streptomyces sp. NPDC051217]|uniref:MarR family winged helix-turn-helix transcriptional regulator n=1 Tax=Streptomyces sp. NPDC051217 TaxID=3365644 RepID=UPI00378B5941